MQRSASYVTGPAAVLRNAPTGHTEAHAGSSQFMHSRRMNFSPLVSTTVYLCSDCRCSAATVSSYCSLFSVAHACSHCLHPMHMVESYSSALLIERASWPRGEENYRTRFCWANGRK